MPKFLVLYRSTVSAAHQMSMSTPELAKAGMDAWMAWAGKAGPAIVDIGSPLGGAQSLTKTESNAGDDKIGGFSIMQSESRQTLEKLLQQHPHFMAPGATIEVREFLPMPGM